MPIGLYWAGPPSLRRGALALVCLPGAISARGRARGYLPAGGCASDTSPVGKQIAAIAGDEIEFHEASLVVNGEVVATSRLRSRDSLDRPLRHEQLGARRVDAGEIWLLGIDDERSWDSRYFGPVPESSVIASLHPIATFALVQP